MSHETVTYWCLMHWHYAETRHASQYGQFFFQYWPERFNIGNDFRVLAYFDYITEALVSQSSFAVPGQSYNNNNSTIVCF